MKGNEKKTIFLMALLWKIDTNWISENDIESRYILEYKTRLTNVLRSTDVTAEFATIYSAS